MLLSVKMSESNERIRYILKFYYKKGKNATQAAKKLCDIDAPNAMSVRVTQSRFKRFQFENFDGKDAPLVALSLIKWTPFLKMCDMISISVVTT